MRERSELHRTNIVKNYFIKTNSNAYRVNHNYIIILIYFINTPN
jgi:hypothetical protein